MKTPRTTIAVLLAACAISVSLAWAQDHSGHKGPAPSAAAKPKVKPYPLATCVVSGEKLGGDMGEPHVFVHEGQEIKLCCKSCLKDFQKDPAKFAKKIAAAGPKAKP